MPSALLGNVSRFNVGACVRACCYASVCVCVCDVSRLRQVNRSSRHNFNLDCKLQTSEKKKKRKEKKKRKRTPRFPTTWQHATYQNTLSARDTSSMKCCRLQTPQPSQSVHFVNAELLSESLFFFLFRMNTAQQISPVTWQRVLAKKAKVCWKGTRGM